MQANIPDVVIEHFVIKRWNFYLFAGDGEVPRLFPAVPQDVQGDLGPDGAADEFYCVVDLHINSSLIPYLQDFIQRLESRAFGRRIFKWRDDDKLVVPNANLGSNAPELARNVFLEFFNILRREEVGVGVAAGVNKSV